MPDEPKPASIADRPTGLAEEALDTGRLLVEFLHTAYATRHEDDSDDTADVEGGAGSLSPGLSSLPPPLSRHGLRAAIHIYMHGERTVGQLAAGLGISYGWASRVAEELETTHYAIRERDTGDRRVVRVRLSPEVLDEVERAYGWRAKAVEEALLPMSESGRESVRDFLRRLTEILRVGPADSREAPGGR